MFWNGFMVKWALQDSLETPSCSGRHLPLRGRNCAGASEKYTLLTWIRDWGTARAGTCSPEKEPCRSRTSVPWCRSPDGAALLSRKCARVRYFGTGLGAYSKKLGSIFLKNGKMQTGWCENR